MKLSNVNSKYGAPMGRGGLTESVFATRAEGEGANYSGTSFPAEQVTEGS